MMSVPGDTDQTMSFKNYFDTTKDKILEFLVDEIL